MGVVMVGIVVSFVLESSAMRTPAIVGLVTFSLGLLALVVLIAKDDGSLLMAYICAAMAHTVCIAGFLVLMVITLLATSNLVISAWARPLLMRALWATPTLLVLILGCVLQMVAFGHYQEKSPRQRTDLLALLPIPVTVWLLNFALYGTYDPMLSLVIMTLCLIFPLVLFARGMTLWIGVFYCARSRVMWDCLPKDAKSHPHQELGGVLLGVLAVLSIIACLIAEVFLQKLSGALAATSLYLTYGFTINAASLFLQQVTAALYPLTSLLLVWAICKKSWRFVQVFLASACACVLCCAFQMGYLIVNSSYFTTSDGLIAVLLMTSWTLVELVAFFYFLRSVRLRTYLGSDAYLTRSALTRWLRPPNPAIPKLSVPDDSQSGDERGIKYTLILSIIGIPILMGIASVINFYVG